MAVEFDEEFRRNYSEHFDTEDPSTEDDEEMATKKDDTATPSNQPAEIDVEAIKAEAAERARAEEKGKLYPQLQTIKQERDELEARLKKVEEDQRQRELAAMKPDQRHQEQIADLEKKLQQAQQTTSNEVNALKMQLRATELAHYRELVLRKYGDQILPDLVNGSSEAEIDQMAEMASKAYKDVYAKASAEVEARFQAQQPQTQVPVPAVPAPPPNPAYVPQGYPGSGAGFPTPNNAESMQEGQPEQFDLKGMTSEEAVRSGRWGGEQRARVLDSMKRLRPGTSSLAATPLRSVQPVQGHQAMPGGVQQPVGHPTGPASNPNYQPPTVPQPAAPQGGPLSPADAARAAVARTHQGTNPAVAQNPGAQQQLSQAQAHAQQNGIPSAQAAFNQRFAPTPPITNTGG